MARGELPQWGKIPQRHLCLLTGSCPGESDFYERRIMKLTAKLLLVFLVAILLVTTVYGFFAVRREEVLFAERVNSEARSTALAMEEIWRLRGTSDLIAALEGIAERSESYKVRWVWFDLPSSDPAGPSLRSTQLRQLRLGEILSIPTTRPDGRAFLYVYWPLATAPRLGGTRPGGLEFSYPMRELEQSKRNAIYETLGLLAGLVATAGLLVSASGISLVAHPLRLLIDKTRRVAAGDLSQPLQLRTGDELSELASSLNDMCAQLETSRQQIAAEAAARLAAVEQLRHDDRLRTVGRLASGIAHELGTPLNVISGRADLIASGQLDSGQRQESARIVKSEAERMTTIIRQLLAFARREASTRVAVSLPQVVRQTVDLLSPLAEKQAVQLEFDPGGQSCEAEVDMGQIQQVVTNVIMNAIQASPPGATVRIAIAQTQLSSADSWEPRPGCAISISDQGSGIAENDLDQIFEPFYTTKDVGEGTGLGLSIAQRIVEEHGGSIEVESSAGAGATFRILLPARGESPIPNPD